MKVSKRQLKRLIREEKAKLLSEAERYSDEWYDQQGRVSTDVLEDELADKLLPLLRQALAQGLDHEGINNATQMAKDALRG